MKSNQEINLYIHYKIKNASPVNKADLLLSYLKIRLYPIHSVLLMKKLYVWSFISSNMIDSIPNTE